MFATHNINPKITNKMNVPKDALEVIKTNLQHGEQAEIAVELGCTPEYISMQLNGAKELTVEVYNLALKKIKAKKAKDRKALLKLTKLLA